MCFLLLLYLTAPNRKRDVSKFKGFHYAHRGLHNSSVPENSLPAFRAAAARGIGVELDVQMTKDGRLVVFHDGNLKRICGVDGYLRDYTYEELATFRLMDTDEKIPLLAEALHALNGSKLICEIKTDNGAKNYELCQKVYESLRHYPGDYCVESFSPFLVGWFRKHHPKILRGQLSGRMNRPENSPVINFTLTHMLLNCISRPDFIAYHFTDSKMFGYRFVKAFFRPFRVCWAPRGDREISLAAEEFDTIIFEENA